MLRLILKLLAGLAAFLLLLVGIAAVALPRLVNTDEFRSALHESAAEALGTPVEWTNVEVGLVPLRLIIEEPALVGDVANRQEASLAAESVDLRLSAMALLQSRVQVDSLVLRGVELVVSRTEEGFILPVPSGEDPAPQEGADAMQPAPGEPTDDNAPDSTPDPETDPTDETEEGFDLALRRILIADSRIVLHDRTLERPIEWRFDDVRLEALGGSIEEPLEIDFSALAAAGDRPIGRIGTTGTVSFSGIYDLEVELEELLLAEIQPYITDATVAGVLSGQIMLEGAPEVVSSVEAELQIEQMAVRSFGLDLAGRLELEAHQALDDPIEFEAELDLGPGGKTSIDGTMDLAGEVDAKMTLDALDLVPFAKLAGEEMQISGLATGGLEIRASAENGLSRLTTDLKVANARYADAALDVGGTLDLVLGLDGLEQDDPVRFDVALNMGDGGHIDAEGTATLAGSLDAKLVLGAVDLAPVAPWVPEGTRVEGQITGDADVRLTKEQRVERLEAKLRVASARVVSDPVDVTGEFDVTVGLTGEGPIQLVAGLVLNDGSGLTVEGTSTVDGVVDIEAELKTFDLAIAKPFLPDPEMELAGIASGTGRLVGALNSPEFFSMDLGVEKGAFKTSEYLVEGPFLATAKVKDPLTRPRGRVDLDLTAARLEYLDQFTKAAGMRAEMTTRFVPEESGEIVFESKLKLRNIDEILLQGAIGETTSIAVTTSNFNLKGWSEVFPALEPYDANGMIRFEGIGVELVDGSPSQFGGQIAIRGVGLTVPDAGRLRMRGSILGEGTTIRTKGLRVLVGGATVGIKGVVEDPLGAGEFDLSVKTLGEAETNELLSELTSAKDLVYGALVLNGNVTGAMDNEAGLYESLDGELRFSIGKDGGGRLRGVSILRTILDQIPLLGGAAKLTQPFRGGKSVDDYFTERFEVIEGDFVIGAGLVDAKMLRLSYPGYEARLSGPLQLQDLGIDMTGEVLLKGDLVSSIGGMAGAEIADRKPIRIQLARVTNTLDDPKVVMTKETLAAVPKLLFQATGLDTITLGIGKTVGDAIGRALDRGK